MLTNNVCCNSWQLHKVWNAYPSQLDLYCVVPPSSAGIGGRYHRQLPSIQLLEFCPYPISISNKSAVYLTDRLLEVRHHSEDSRIAVWTR